MMRHLIIAILFLSITLPGYNQTFLDAYKKYKLANVDTVSNRETRKKLKSFIKSQIIELDTVFKSYKARTGFDFNTTDTLFLIYDAPAESPYTSDIIIWSGKDTISYAQGIETLKPSKYKRIITYKPFISPAHSQPRQKVITQRDSLLTLVSKRDFTTIEHLGDNQSINGGRYVRIYLAYKVGGQYKFETCYPKPFIIRNVYQKE